MQFLKVARFSKFGAYLIDEDNNEVLLPNAYLNDEIKLDSLVWVFVYTDSKDRAVAVTTMPKALLGDIVALEVKDIASNGIYLDLGVLKDLFMPSKNPNAFKIAQKVVVKICLDKQKRLIARQNISDYLLKLKKDSRLSEVSILPFLKTPLGLNCVINGKFFGIIHNNDLNKDLMIGKEARARIKKIRDDGKADLALVNNFKEIEEMILTRLREGALALDYNSSSEEIFKALQISKKAFKRATASLIREERVEFVGEGDKLILKLT